VISECVLVPNDRLCIPDFAGKMGITTFLHAIPQRIATLLQQLADANQLSDDDIKKFLGALLEKGRRFELEMSSWSPSAPSDSDPEDSVNSVKEKRDAAKLDPLQVAASALYSALTGEGSEGEVPNEVYLECRTGGSKKFYKMTLVAGGLVVRTNYGRIGTEGTFDAKVFADAEEGKGESAYFAGHFSVQLGRLADTDCPLYGAH